MYRDLDRFDLAGLATVYSPSYGSSLHPTAFLDHLPDGAVVQSGLLLFVCCHRDENRRRIAAHELVHAMQHTEWDIDSTASSFPYRRLLQEGTARQSEYALGYLDRYDLRTAGPVSLWLAEGGRLHEAPRFLCYEIRASLVDALLRRCSPDALWSILSGPCRSSLWNFAVDQWDGFDVAFEETLGQSWGAFLDVWSSEAGSVTPAPGSEHVYRWLQDAYGLRAILLAPLLGTETLDRIGAAEDAVYYWNGYRA
ncbi:MAG: hypothetical protein WBC63_09675 [Candidatus Bipolaricaulia bacterium]